MRASLIAPLALACAIAPWAAGIAAAQSATGPDLAVRGYAAAGTMIFSADQSFDAVLGRRALPTFGGGVEVVLRDHLFVGVGAWRAAHDGERVFVGPDQSVFPLGIPLKVTITPLELTGGWRFTGLSSRVVPYAGGGFSSFRYTEDSDTDEASDDLSGRFNGFHLLGGAEVRVSTWIGVAGEVVWTSIPNGLGDSGASQAFDETNLGGTAIRVKVVVGR